MPTCKHCETTWENSSILTCPSCNRIHIELLKQRAIQERNADKLWRKR
jgi:hypothetical protein